MTAVDLNGATVVVTGASRGFGRATAVALAESGAQVVGVARHRSGLEDLQRELGDATEHTRRLGAAVLLEPREGRSVVSSPVAGDVALWEPKR